MLNETACWEKESQHGNKLNVAQTKMLCQMSRTTGLDEIKNDGIRESWSKTYRKKDG